MRKENNLNVVEYLEERFGGINLELEVIDSLDYEMEENSTLDEWISFISDIVNYGLEGGSVGSMIYTRDIEKFALDNSDDLIEILDYLGIELKVEHGYLTKLAYIGYEYVCSEILDVLQELEDEVEIECLA